MSSMSTPANIPTMHYYQTHEHNIGFSLSISRISNSRLHRRNVDNLPNLSRLITFALKFLLQNNITTFFVLIFFRFESDRPLSFQEPIVFEDSLGNKYPLNITATADNSLLTCYPFVAQHRMDHQIVCEEVRYHRIS